MLRQGDLLEGKYKILQIIGKGGMSRVWLAMDTTLNKQWAVKEINKNSVEYRETVNENKTLTEIEIMKKLNHPALPRIVSIIDNPGSLCVVMDYIEGETLLKVLKMYDKIDEDTIVSWMLDVCDVLDYLHHQNPPIIYRDMKPSNIMLTPEGRIKIIDFGIAREYKGGRDDTLPLGTRGYASPEHYTKHTDVRSDVYTVGATMYQLLTKKDPTEPPYKILPIRQVDPSLSTGLEKIILKATKTDPDERYQTIQELSNALESYKQLDDSYIENLEKKVKGFQRKVIASIACIIAGIILIISGIVMNQHNYNKLLNSDTLLPEQRARELSRAIDIRPARSDAYIDLIKVYASDGRFTEDEGAEFSSIYNKHKEDLEKSRDYAATNYKIGEAFLKYYTGKSDDSARARLLSAEPYFEAAAKDKDFNKRTLAENYVFMAEYYKDYVLGDTSLVAKDASRKTYRKLLTKCDGTIDALNKYEGSGKSKMKVITYDVILNLIDDQRNSMAAKKLPKSDIEHVLDKMERSASRIDDPEDKQKVMDEINSISEKVDLTYQAIKKESGK